MPGKYSLETLPHGFLAHYQKALDDPDLLSARDEVALMEAIIADRVGRINAESGTSNTWWRDLVRVSNELRDAQDIGDREQFAALVVEQQKLIKQGGDLGKLLDEIATLVEKQSRVREREWKRLVDLKLVMQGDRVMALVEALVEAVQRHVPDQAVQGKIHSEFAKLLGPSRN